jgi:glycosyltransferase involved in cell wall biosynthesis
MLTVLLATRNGAKTLPDVLECYCGVQAPPGGWKIVIVDNGSTDRTRSIIQSYLDRLPLTYLFEARLGKNVALNAGLANIAGDLVVFTDDDTFPSQDWLVHMRAAADVHSDYDIFGGAIVPRWQRPPESLMLAWVPLDAVFSVTDPTIPEGPNTGTNVFGPNMAVRNDLFARGYRFDPQIGPRGSNYPMGSETDFVYRLVKLGFKAWYCPHVVVEHFIPQSHMRSSWVLRRAVRFGRGQYRLVAQDKRRTYPSWFGVPRYIVRELIMQQASVLTALIGFNRKKLFEARWRFNYLWGKAIEARAINLEAREWVDL